MKKTSSLLVLTILFQNITFSYAAGPGPSASNSLNEITVVPNAAPIVERPAVAQSRCKDVRNVVIAFLTFGLVVGGTTCLILDMNGYFDQDSNNDGSSAPKSITEVDFSGYTWYLKASENAAPGPNAWAHTDDAVFIDQTGSLNLKVLNTSDKWRSSEVTLLRPLGYGTYEFEVKMPLNLDPNLASSLFLYSNENREFDIQMFYAGNNDNIQYAVQPSNKPGNKYSFHLQTTENGILKHRISWSKERVLFESLIDGVLTQSFSYTGVDNFVPGFESLVLNHFMIGGNPPTDGKESSLIVKSFKFLPPQISQGSSSSSSTGVSSSSSVSQSSSLSSTGVSSSSSVLQGSSGSSTGVSSSSSVSQVSSSASSTGVSSSSSDLQVSSSASSTGVSSSSSDPQMSSTASSAGFSISSSDLKDSSSASSTEGSSSAPQGG